MELQNPSYIKSKFTAGIIELIFGLGFTNISYFENKLIKSFSFFSASFLSLELEIISSAYRDLYKGSNLNFLAIGSYSLSLSGSSGNSYIWGLNKFKVSRRFILRKSEVD